MFDPSLTILTTVKNGMPYLKNAVESVLNQNYKNYLYIIVDDGSSDETPRYLSSIKDQKIIVCTIEPSGIPTALNHGLNKIQTEYFAILDSDDLCHPERLQAQINFLNNNREYVLVGTSVNYIGNGGFNRNFKVKMPKENEKITDGLRSNKFVIAHPTVMIRTKAVKEIGGYNYYSSLIPDADLYIRLIKKGKLSNLDNIYSSIRLSAKSFTSSNAKNILKAYSDVNTMGGHNEQNMLKKISLKLNYYSQYLYKKALIKYLNGKSVLWFLLLVPAALMYPPKTFYFIKQKFAIR